VLARRAHELAQIVDVGPVGLTNLANIYIPTNWDPAKPWLSTVSGRTGSANLRGALGDDLDTQLGFALGSVCAGLPPAQQAQLAAFCTALTSSGNNLGAVLSQVIERGGFSPTAGATSLTGLLGGVS
jgi:hypothetical protein